MAGGAEKEIFERLVRIEQTLARVDERTAQHDKAHNDHEERLRDLERKDAKRSGVLAVASIVGGLIVTALSWVVNLIIGRLQ